MKRMRWSVRIALLLALLPLAVFGTPDKAGADGDNLVQNGGFELKTGSSAPPWVASGGWGTFAVPSGSAARTGSEGLKLQTDQSSANPWVNQGIGIEPGATYELSVWVKSVVLPSSGAGFKLEFYKDTRTTANHLEGDLNQRMLRTELNGDWQRLAMEFTAPEEANIVSLYLRLYGTGTVYFDDASLVLKRHRPLIALKTDALFYYAEQTEGRVTAKLPVPAGVPANSTVTTTVYREANGVPIAVYGPTSAAQPIAFTFDPSQMIKEEPYRVEARLLGPLGETLETVYETIYRYDRPTMMRTDGTLLVNGQPFFPVGAYHVNRVDYPFAAAAGINTIQAVPANKVSTMQATLDAAHASGLKVMVGLYYNMNVGENAALTETMVTALKDHPAVLAWMVMDEPVQNNKSQKELMEAYRLVHSIDKAHPIYMVESPAAAYEPVAKVADILSVDVYPLPYSPISLVGERTALARQATGGVKPVWNVLQAMYNPPNWPHLPTIAEVRNMAYQSLLNGSQGLLYYSLNENGFVLRDSALWPGLVEFRPELELLGRLVTSGERAGADTATDAAWTLWRDGDELYAAVVNTGETSRQVTIPLEATGFRAQLLYGDLRSTRDEQGSELTVTLAPLQSLLYRIVPFASMVEQADDVAGAAGALSADTYWTNRISQLEAVLADMTEELSDPTPNIDEASGLALDGLTVLDDLDNWAGQLADTPARKAMLGALEKMRERLGPVAASSVQIRLVPADSRMFGQQEPNGLNIDVRHTRPGDLRNITMTLIFPEPFELQPVTRSVYGLGSGLSVSEAFDFRIAAPAQAGRYELQARIGFEYAGAPGKRVTVNHYVTYPYVNLLEAEALPALLEANGGGELPFSIRLKSIASRTLQATLNSTTASPGLTVQLPVSLSVPAQGQVTVSGKVYLPATITDGVHGATIQILADGNPVQSLPLSVAVSRNLLRNPGFERPNSPGTAPDGWTMRQSVWVQDEMHSGDYALSLLPDPNNAWNVAVSGLMPTQAGKTYTLSGWVKNASTAGNVSIGLRQVKADGAATISYVWKPAAASSDWTYYELNLTPASNAKYIQVYLLSDTATNGPAWFDDLYVDER
ncbi:carbohydrate binding domain-containing protein [Paenibacillus hodogayensis]|uniref:Carbohydrate binding domain-containing protein n=1 Tax=Paenibacillus hodogayensis TaxID=279208 RepID=A0ABV5W4N1_9BACL